MARTAGGKVVIKDEDGKILGEATYIVVPQSANRASMDSILAGWSDAAVRRAINHSNAAEARAQLKMKLEGPAKALDGIVKNAKVLGVSDEALARALAILRGE